MNRRCITTPWVLALFALVLPVGVNAHLKYEKSDPAQDVVLSAPPRQVQVWFNERPDPAVSRMELQGPSNAKLVQLHVMDEKSLMAMVDGEMPDGAYTIAWQSAGDDGHVLRGEINFTVKRSR